MFHLFMHSFLHTLLQPGVRAVLHLVLQSRQAQPLVDTKRLRPRLMVLKCLINSFLCEDFRTDISPIEICRKIKGPQNSCTSLHMVTWRGWIAS